MKKTRNLIDPVKPLLMAAFLMGSINEQACAAEAYGAAGLPGVMFGVGDMLSDSVALRGDISTLGVRNIDINRTGLTSTAKVSLNRAGLYSDWFPFSSIGLRLTGGLTFNDAKLNVKGHGTGELVFVGTDPYLLTQFDRYSMRATFPVVSPYIGMGWGHKFADQAAWSFLFDVGVSLGKARVTGNASGPILSSPDAQRDFQQELGTWRGKADQYPFLPQISLGVSHHF